MPDFSKRVEKKAAEFLGDGEQFVFAVVAQPPGSITKGVNDQGLRGARGVADAVRAKGAAGQQGETIAARTPTSNAFLTLTSQRLVWIGQTKLGMASGDVVGSYDLGEIAEAEWSKGSGVGNRELRLTFVDESDVAVLVHKSQKPDRLESELSSRIT